MEIMCTWARKGLLIINRMLFSPITEMHFITDHILYCIKDNYFELNKVEQGF